MFLFSRPQHNLTPSCAARLDRGEMWPKALAPLGSSSRLFWREAFMASLKGSNQNGYNYVILHYTLYS